MADNQPVSLDWSYGALAQGLACYNKAEFFDAHEHWESVWLLLEGPEKEFLQGLIQLTAAFHHLQRGNTAGAISLMRRTLRRLDGRPEGFGGIEVTGLRTEVAQWLHALESGNTGALRLPPAIQCSCSPFRCLAD